MFTVQSRHDDREIPIQTWHAEGCHREVPARWSERLNKIIARVLETGWVQLTFGIADYALIKSVNALSSRLGSGILAIVIQTTSQTTEGLTRLLGSGIMLQTTTLG